MFAKVRLKFYHWTLTTSKAIYVKWTKTIVNSSPFTRYLLGTVFFVRYWWQKVSERQKLILSSFNRLACYWANTYTSRIRVCEATDWRIGLNVRFNVQLNSTRCDNTIDALILLKNESVILQQLIHVTEDVTTVNAHLISAWCCSLWILLICYETAIFVSVYILAFVNVLAPKTANAGKNVFS